MTLDSCHAFFLCKCEELVLEVLIALCHHEAYVHERTILDSCSTLEERVAVDLGVKKRCLLLVHLVHYLDTAELLEPLEGLVHHEDREYRRCVEHRSSVDVCAEVEHCRDVAAHLSEEVLLHDEECNACRAYVLLCTTIDHSILGHVYRTAHDVRRHVCDERNRRVDVLVDLSTIDGVVCGDVEVVNICRDFVTLWNIVEYCFS